MNKKFLELEQLLQKLIELNQASISGDDRKFINEEIFDHGEYGVAFDSLVNGIINADKKISSDTFELINKIGTEMYMTEWSKNSLCKKVEMLSLESVS